MKASSSSAQRQLDSQDAQQPQFTENIRDRQFTFSNKQSFQNTGPVNSAAASQNLRVAEFMGEEPSQIENSINQEQSLMTGDNMSSFQTQPQTMTEHQQQQFLGGRQKKETNSSFKKHQQQQMYQAEQQQSAMVAAQSQPIEQFGQMIKIVLVGESGVGKTALVHRYMKNTMPPETLRSTVAVEFGTRKIVLKHRPYKVQVILWDTAGQERFKSLTTHHYQGAHGALLVFDVTSVKSFERARAWVEELTQNTPIGCKTALVTNKCDLAFREVSEDEVRSFAHQNNLLYYETSSLWNRDDDELVTNVDCRGGIGILIDSMVEEIIDDIVTERLSNVHNTLERQASEYHHGNSSPRGGGPFSMGDRSNQTKYYHGGRVSGGIKLGQNNSRNLYDVEEEPNNNEACGC